MALALGGPRLKWDCLTLARNNALSWLPTRPISHILTLTLVLTYLGLFRSEFFIKVEKLQIETVMVSKGHILPTVLVVVAVCIGPCTLDCEP